MLILLDSNILIRWLEPGHPDQILLAGILDRWTRAGETLCYAPQNLGEFWNASTRPRERNGYGLTPEETNRRALAIEASLHLLPDNLDVYRVWRRLLVEHEVCGVQVHDARLAATMLVHSVPRILTFKARDFARFPVEALHPAQLAQS